MSFLPAQTRFPHCALACSDMCCWCAVWRLLQLLLLTVWSAASWGTSWPGKVCNSTWRRAQQQLRCVRLYKLRWHVAACLPGGVLIRS